MLTVSSNIPQIYSLNNSNLKTNANKNKTSIRNNITQSQVSFKGLGVNLAKKAAHSENARKFVLFAKDNKIVTESIFALILTCVLRPIAIVSLDRSEDSKEKNLYAAGHSISSGLLGLGFSLVYNQPIKKIVHAAVDKLLSTEFIGDEKPSKILKMGQYQYYHKIANIKASEFNPAELEKMIDFLLIPKDDNPTLLRISATSLFNYKHKLNDEALFKKTLGLIKTANAESIKTFLDKLFDAVSLPVKGTLTIMAIPIILGFLGIKKSSIHKNTQKSNSVSSNNMTNQINTAKESSVETNLLKKYTGGKK